MVPLQSLEIVGGRFIEVRYLRRRELGGQLIRHVPGNVTLDREDVLCRKGSIIGLGPELAVLRRIDQLDVDPYPVAGPLHLPAQQGAGAQLLPDLQNVLAGVRVLADRRARGDLETANASESGQDFVLDSVGEALVRIGSSAGLEGQD